MAFSFFIKTYISIETLSNEIENDIKRIEYFSKVECDSSILRSEDVKDKSRVQDCISLQLRRKK